MKKQPAIAICAGAAILFAAAAAYAQRGDDSGQGQAVVTVLPAKNNEQPVRIATQDLSLKVDGKAAEVTSWSHLRGSRNPVQLVFLIDTAARASLGTQTNEITHFIQQMPPDTKMAIAYMEDGRAAFTSQFSSDPAAVLKGLHITAGPPGESGSPYFCLSDLAKHWPSQDRAARRVVVMITDGVDNYYVHYNPEDPYVQAAIEDSARGGLIVYSLFWQSTGRFGRSGWAANDGQNLLLEVTQATGGASYWEGMGNPVSFQPYLEDLQHRLTEQYEVAFSAPIAKPTVARLQLKVAAPGTKIDAPQQVFVHPAGHAIGAQ